MLLHRKIQKELLKWDVEREFLLKLNIFEQMLIKNWVKFQS